MSDESEKEENEKIMRKELTVLSLSYLFHTQELMKQLKNINDELERKNFKNQIKEREIHIEYLNRFKSILDEIIKISDLLKSKTITEEERKYFIQQRESLRNYKDANTISEMKRRLELYKANPDLLKKKIKRPEGILGSPKFLKGFVICIFLFILLGTLSGMIWYFIVTS